MNDQRSNHLRQLRAFCAAAACGSISKAAEQLSISQPSVSLHIQNLEKRFNTTLFERRGPKIQLTPAGAVLEKLSAPLVEAIDKLPASFSATLGEVTQGQLNIASGQSTLLYMLPDAIKTFTEQYPQINVALHSVTGRAGMALIREEKVDFAVGAMFDVPDDLVYHPLVEYEPMLITALDHPLAKSSAITLEDLSEYGLILPPRHLTTWQQVNTVFSNHNVPYSIALEAGGWEVIKRYVEMGLGISIVTSICLRSPHQLFCHPMSQYFPKRSYGVVYRRGRFMTPQALRFLSLLAPERFANMDPLTLPLSTLQSAALRHTLED